jgi:hypothetical protein
MTNNNPITTVLLLLLLSTQVLTASRRLVLPAPTPNSQPPKMSIAQAMQYIDNLVSSLTRSRTTLTPKTPLFRFDEQPKPDTTPMTEAMDIVKEGLDTFSENFGDFFEANKIKDTLKYLEDNSYDFFNIGKESTLNSMNSLGTGLRRMSKIKNTVTVMLTGIKDGSNLVTDMYGKWKEGEFTDEQQGKIWIVGLKSLDKTLEDAMKTCGTVQADLLDVADEMNRTENEFRSLAALFEKAANEPQGQEQQSFFGAFIQNSVVSCIVPCAGGVFAAFFGAFGGLATCAACVGNGLVQTIKAEQNRVNAMIPKNNDMMTQFRDAMNTMVGLAGVVKDTATRQAESVNTFDGKLRTMEN